MAKNMSKRTNETRPVGNDRIIELLEQIREILEQLVEKNRRENSWKL